MIQNKSIDIKFNYKGTGKNKNDQDIAVFEGSSNNPYELLMFSEAAGLGRSRAPKRCVFLVKRRVVRPPTCRRR